LLGPTQRVTSDYSDVVADMARVFGKVYNAEKKTTKLIKSGIPSQLI